MEIIEIASFQIKLNSKKWDILAPVLEQAGIEWYCPEWEEEGGEHAKELIHEYNPFKDKRLKDKEMIFSYSDHCLSIDESGGIDADFKTLLSELKKFIKLTK